MDDGLLQQGHSALHDLRTSTRSLNGEPQFRFLADPPGNSLVETYLQHETDSKAVLYVEMPSHEQRPSGKAWLSKVLLRATGDPAWDKKEASYSKELRVKDRLTHTTALVIVTDIHHLVHEPQIFDCLLSLFQTGMMMPLLIVGEPTQMRQRRKAPCTGLPRT